MRQQFVAVMVAVGLVLAADARVRATAIVLLVTPDRIVLAADSRQTWRRSEPDDLGCKIWQAGNNAAAMSGAVARAPGKGFDATITIPAILKRPGSVRERYSWAVEELTLADAGAENPETLTVNLLFVMFDAGVASLARGNATFPGASRSVPDTCLRSCSGASALTSGKVPADVQTASLDAAALAMKARPSESAMIERAKAIVARFAKEDPERIGGPIDVLVLDAHGAHWKPCKPSCGSGD